MPGGMLKLRFDWYIRTRKTEIPVRRIYAPINVKPLEGGRGRPGIGGALELS